MTMTVIICRPRTFPLRRITHCPTCKRRRRFAGRDAVWYGTHWTCCACGDSWEDGERCPRPFRRGWRKDAVADARRVWQDAGQYTRQQYQDWLREEIGPGVDDSPSIVTVEVPGVSR